MARKNNNNNPLQIRIEAVSIPARMSPQSYLKHLLNYVRHGVEFPRGMEVNLHWRNPETKQGRTKNWQEDEFQDAFIDCSEGFRGMVEGAILRQLRRVQR